MSNQSLQVIDEAMARIFGGVDHRIRYLGPDATGFEEDAYNRGYKAGAEDAFALIERVEELRGQRDALLTACKALLAEHTKCAGPAIQSDAKMMARNAIDTAEAE